MLFVFAEILSDPTVTSRLSDTKVSVSACLIIFLIECYLKNGEKHFVLFNCQAAGEVKALEDFYKMLQHEPNRAFYG